MIGISSRPVETSSERRGASRAGSLVIAVVVAAGIIVGLRSGSPTVLLGVPLGGAVAWHASGELSRRREVRSHREALIVEVERVIQRLKAGRSLASAVDESTVIGRHAELDDSPRALGADEHLILATFEVLRRRGGAALPSLERLNDTLRSSAALALETEAQAAQATASALVLAALPGLFIVALAGFQPSLRAFYLHDPLGTACLLVATLLSYAGWSVMHRLIGSVR